MDSETVPVQLTLAGKPIFEDPLEETSEEISEARVYELNDIDGVSYLFGDYLLVGALFISFVTFLIELNNPGFLQTLSSVGKEMIQDGISALKREDEQ